MLTQLNPPIPLQTPKGKAWAVALIDYGPHWDLQWVTFLHDSGECWTFINSDIRQEQNLTFAIPAPSPLGHSPAGGNGKSNGNGHYRPQAASSHGFHAEAPGKA